MLKKYKHHLLVFLAGISWSTLAIFSVYASQAGINPFNQVFWRLIFGVICSFVVGVFIFKQPIKLKEKKAFGYLFLNAIFFILALTTFSASIYLGSPIAKAVALNYSYPVAVIVFSYIVFKDKPTFKNILAVFISFISLYLLLELWKVKNLTEIQLGDLFAWLNSFAFAAIIVWGTKIRKDLGLSPFITLFYSYAIAIPLLFIFSAIFSFYGSSLFSAQVMANFGRSGWLSLLGLGTISSVLPLSLMYFGAGKLKSVVTSILLLSEPIFVYIAGIILFGQQLSAWGVIGALGIIIALLLT